MIVLGLSLVKQQIFCKILFSFFIYQRTQVIQKINKLRMGQEQETLKKLNQITTEVNKLKQKLRTQQLSKTNIEQKLSFYDSKIGILTQQRTNRIEHNQNQFDIFLTQSSTFREYLKRSESNNIVNFKKMQEHINTAISTMYGKFSTVQQKMLSLIDQKEKVLQQMSYQIDNHTVSIKALQDWIRINQGQNRSLSIYQQNMNARYQALAKEFQIKARRLEGEAKLIKTQGQALDQKIKYFDQLFKKKTYNQQSKQQKNTGRKHNQSSFELKVNDKIEAIHQKLEQFSLQIKKIHSKISIKTSSQQYSAIKSKNLSENSANQETDILKDKMQALQSRLQNIIKGNTQLNSNIKDDRKLQQMQKNIKKCQQQVKIINEELSLLKQKIDGDQPNKDPVQISNYDSVQRPSNIPLRYQNQYDQYEERGMQSNFNQAKNLRQGRSKFQRHNNQLKQSQLNEIDISQMRGGIRGLLKKSKQKQEPASSLKKNKQSLLSPLKKQLPPKKNPLPPMKNSLGIRNNRLGPNQIYEDQQQESEDMYQIDEQGFLIDSEGRYLTNQYGQRMQLSGQQINQILKQQGAI